MELVYLVIVLVVVMYFNKVIKKFTAVVADNLDIALDMSTDEMQQVRADQIVRHAKNDLKRGTAVASIATENRVTAEDIIEMRKKNQL
jgi:hypothetical protein